MQVQVLSRAPRKERLDFPSLHHSVRRSCGIDERLREGEAITILRIVNKPLSIVKCASLILAALLLLWLVLRVERNHTDSISIKIKTTDPKSKSEKRRIIAPAPSTTQPSTVRSKAQLRLAAGLWGEIGNTGLQLSSEQLQLLEKDFFDFMEVKGNLEAPLVHVEHYDGVTLKISVPAYPVEGKALRDAFIERIQKDFPGPLGNDIEDSVGAYFDVAFKGYGIMNQEIEVRRSADYPGQFHLKLTATTVSGFTPSRLPNDNWMNSTSGDLYFTGKEDFGPPSDFPPIWNAISQAFGNY